MDGLGDVIARIRSYAPDGLDSDGVEPFGHSEPGHQDIELAPFVLPTRSRFGGEIDRFGPDAAEIDRWVLACIQERFETRQQLHPVRQNLALSGRRERLALTAAAPDQPDTDAAQSRPAALAATTAAVGDVTVADSPLDADPALLAPAPVEVIEDAPTVDLTGDAVETTDNEPVQPAHESVVATMPATRVRARRRRRLATKVVRRIANVVVTAVIVLLFLSQGALGLLPYRASYVLTGSMSPKMPVGSLVIAHQVPASEIHVGDVITFAHPAKPGVDETHRVVAIEDAEGGGKAFVTQGDANGSPDPWRIAIKGKVWQRVFSTPKLGYVFGMLHAPSAHLAVTLLPAFMLAGWVLVWTWKPVLGGRPEDGEDDDTTPAPAPA
jgi:signal peptidase